MLLEHSSILLALLSALFVFTIHIFFCVYLAMMLLHLSKKAEERLTSFFTDIQFSLAAEVLAKVFFRDLC